MTSNPTAAWIWQQLLEATPWGRQPAYLIHDRDAVYGRGFGARLSKLGITSVITPFRAPRANAIAERLVRSIRRECLDHLIVINERHLRAILIEFAEYYNFHRPTGASRCKAPFLNPWFATDRSPDERCLAAFTTFTPGLVELGSSFAPLQRRSELLFDGRVPMP